jgi:hypothetical protein
VQSREITAELGNDQLEAPVTMLVVKDWQQCKKDLQIRLVDATSKYDQYVTGVDDAAEAAIRALLGARDPERGFMDIGSQNGVRGICRG